jgi:cytochrome c-type biogenesis protein
MGAVPSLYLAFFAGLLSFLSPCCLPLYPSYLSYLAGVSLDEAAGEEQRRRVRHRALAHACFFVLGFSLIFLSLGMSASLIGRWFAEYKPFLRQAGGLILVVMGLFLAGVLPITVLYRQRRWDLRMKSVGFAGSFLVGISFAAGWTPCVGPILASILVWAATNPSSGLWLMFFYALGFALPFLLLAYTLGSVRWLLQYADLLSKMSGWIMAGIGVLLITGGLSRLTSWVIRLFGGFTGF